MKSERISREQTKRAPAAEHERSARRSVHGNSLPLHQPSSVKLQTKLTISHPADAYEQEADSIAERVMRMTEPAIRLQRKCACGASGEECEQCASQSLKVQRRAVGHNSSMAAAPPVVHDAVRSQGQPLDQATRAFFEPRFDYDFGRVRIHTDAHAASAASAVNALAFTLGNDVVFSEGKYAPETAAGRRLLAHELTHVVQQSGGAHAPGVKALKESGGDREMGEIAALNGSRVQRQVLDYVGSIIGNYWLGLPPDVKVLFIDKAIDQAIASIDDFPGKFLFGDFWVFVREGLLGFYQKLKFSKEEDKVLAMDKLARIIAGQSWEYTKGLLLGFLKGFFIDGLLGIFILIWDIIKGMKSVWDFFEKVGEVVGNFPDEVKKLLKSFEQFGDEISKQFEPAMEELKKILMDPKGAKELIDKVIEQGKAYAKDAGQKIAESLLSFFIKPGAEADIGETVGRMMGQVTFEVIFAIVTEGAGSTVTAFKKAVNFLARIGGEIAGSILKVFEELHAAFEVIANAVKGAVKFVKEKVLGTIAKSFTKLIEDVKGFIKLILSKCHESKLKCDFGALSKEAGLETRGFRPAPGTRIKPKEIPENWRIKSAKVEGGVRYIDPENAGNSVRVMQGDPKSPYPNSQKPYVRWQKNGQALDVNGNIVPKNSPDAHIPLEDFKFDPKLFK